MKNFFNSFEDNEFDITKSNFIVKSNFFNLTYLVNPNQLKDIHKDIIYLVLLKIDYHAEIIPENVTIDFDDYILFKNILKRNAYSFKEFLKLTKEILEIKSYFLCPITDILIYFNFFQSVKIDNEFPQTIVIEFSNVSKIFFFKMELENYLNKTRKELPIFLTKDRDLKPSYTKIDKNIGIFKSKKIKILYELLSQFKTKGFLKISYLRLKFLIGVAYYANENIISINYESNTLFDVNGKSLIDHYPRFSLFKGNFLDKSIKKINEENRLDIKNIRYSVKRQNQKVVLIVFRFDKVQSRPLTEDENNFCEILIKDFKLTKPQSDYLILNLGIEEIKTRINSFVRKKGAHYIENYTKAYIYDIGAYLFKNVFPELH